MKKNLNLIIVIVNSTIALAYIDPGTGGMIASSIWPLILGIFTAIGAFCVRYFFKPVKRVALKLLRKKE
jgi:hypothetical protein